MTETGLEWGYTKPTLYVCGVNNFNDNFDDKFVREKVNKIASKAKSLNICVLEPNWKWIHD